MLKIENVEVLGWEHAIRGMRNPKNSWAKSDSNWRYVAPAQRENHILASYSDDSEFWIGPNDADLMNRLRNAGTDHRKFMRMITVYLDITAPLYWWKEFDTYKVGTVANSCSTIQTIMMSTGASLEEVNKYLQELNTYSDKTIYSFQDMTSNIGKFTNAGVGLEDAVMAIQGVSNVAAVSGANAKEASRAMYNFAQALSAGYVKLIDWKSIENANR